MNKHIPRFNRLVSAVLTVSVMGVALIGCSIPSGEIVETTVIETSSSVTADVDAVTVDVSSDDLVRMNYREAVDHLLSLGFSNITTVAVGDIMYNSDYVVDSVSGVEIDGQTSFGATDVFEPDAQIYVYYHSIADIEAGNPDLYIGEDYNEVVETLHTLGFTNVQLSEYPDLVFGYLHFDGEVNGVEINGQTDFDDDTVFPSGALVVVSYHTFANEDEAASVDLETLTFEEFTDHLDRVLQATFGDNHTIEIQEDNTLVVSTWSDGVSEMFSLAEAGDMEQFEEWNQFKLEVQSFCEEVIACFEYVEVDDPHLVWNVLDETDTDVVLLTFSDSEFTYDAVPTPTPTNTPTPTPTPTNTPTQTPTPTPSPTPTPVPETRFAFRLVCPTYTIYYIIDTEAHTATWFTSESPQYPSVETFSGDITSGQVACYDNGEFIEYLEMSGRVLILTEYDGYEYRLGGYSLSATEALLE